MENLKTTFLKRYGVYEYIALIFGLMLLFSSGKFVYATSIQVMSWADIGKMMVLASFGILLTGRPLATLDYARKVLGITTRKEKLNEE